MAHEVVFRTPQLSSFDARAAVALALLFVLGVLGSQWFCVLKRHQWSRGADSEYIRTRFMQIRHGATASH